MIFDKIIIGAGLYGLYSALYCAKQNDKVLVLEYDNEPFMRATYINQARVHMGYHYPRSYSTAIKSAGYFERFNEDYGFCINCEFDQIYATSSSLSWTNAEQFKTFCSSAQIPCKEIITDEYFNKGTCDGAFITKEYTYDAMILKKHLLDELSKFPNCTLKFNSRISRIKKTDTHFEIIEDNQTYSTDYLINTTYASINQIIDKIDKKCNFPYFNIKYELCEIIICNASPTLKNTGITVMDGPFFSIMPFGKTGYHSLTSVNFTPHQTSYDRLPTFPCQYNNEKYCRPDQLGNCNFCPQKIESSYQYMSRLAKKYLHKEYQFEYVKSLYSIKPILMASEIDDSRPTVIKTFCDKPKFISVLSGKINTIYDLDEVLKK